MLCLARGKHVSFQRGKHTLNPKTSLIKIEGVDTPKSAEFYNGKRIAYVYRAKKEIRGTKIRVIWGKVTRPHGTSTCIRGLGKAWVWIEERQADSYGTYRQLGSRPRTVPAQPSAQVSRRHGPRHALPQRDIGAVLRRWDLRQWNC